MSPPDKKFPCWDLQGLFCFVEILVDAGLIDAVASTGRAVQAAWDSQTSMATNNTHPPSSRSAADLLFLQMAKKETTQDQKMLKPSNSIPKTPCK